MANLPPRQKQLEAGGRTFLRFFSPWSLGGGDEEGHTAHPRSNIPLETSLLWDDMVSAELS